MKSNVKLKCVGQNTHHRYHLSTMMGIVTQLTAQMPGKLSAESIQLLECRMGKAAADEVFCKMLSEHIASLVICLDDTEAAKKLVGIKYAGGVSGNDPDSCRA